MKVQVAPVTPSCTEVMSRHCATFDCIDCCRPICSRKCSAGGGLRVSAKVAPFEWSTASFARLYTSVGRACFLLHVCDVQKCEPSTSCVAVRICYW